MLPERETEQFTTFIMEVMKQGGKRHKYYKQTVEHHEDMKIHVEGCNPIKILDAKRPNEPDEIKQYRLDSYNPRTKSKCDKVISIVSRIFNPKIYTINFKDAEELETYLTEEYPFYRSLMGFIKQTFIRKDFSDPNAVLAVLPKEWETDGTERFDPICYIYHSERVLKFELDEYFIIDITEYEDKKRNEHPKKLMIIDRENILYVSLEE